jgi:hypothetical protein
MRKIRDILRLALGEGLSRRQVGASWASRHAGVRDVPGRAGRFQRSLPIARNKLESDGRHLRQSRDGYLASSGK